MNLKNKIMGGKKIFLALFGILFFFSCKEADKGRAILSFNKDWCFSLAADSLAAEADYNDASWRKLNLPHDWSIEGNFDKDHATTPSEGALPAGIGWYRKTFMLSEGLKSKRVSVLFEGVYRNSEVWINGHYLGKRPFGYISFSYDLTPYLKYEEENVLAVKVDNHQQPNSRWYTGSGIYRDVWLIGTNDISISLWGTFVKTKRVEQGTANIELQVNISNRGEEASKVVVKSTVLDAEGNRVAEQKEPEQLLQVGHHQEVHIDFDVKSPQLWSPAYPYMYRVVTTLLVDDKVTDTYETPLGIRTFYFDSEKGFFLNGKYLKLKGVCLHHDLGALGAAYNKRANQRQLELLKEMGCNAIRTAHNPFDPDFYDLCDHMGFLVMDEAFDVWKKKKVAHDYHEDFEEWHVKDLTDMVLRDCNHPSVIMYSIGNEIREQFDSTGITITKELVDIVKRIDSTRPVTSALTENQPEKNYISRSGALDVLGFNYKNAVYDSLMRLFPGQKILASENVSALASRGHYDMPADSIRVWPEAYNIPLKGANDDFTASAYDNAHAYWGSTNEQTLNMINKHDYVAGMFLWTGFDYLGEPTPYPYPARSSYFGAIDLAGFPKDTYYLYKSVWSTETVLHVFPHWNWQEGQTVDVWAYYNNADEVELFLNGKSQGVKHKQSGDLHVSWQVPFKPGVLKAISRKDGEVVAQREVKTAGTPTMLRMAVDRSTINADGKDLTFVEVHVVDENGTIVPNADNLIKFKVTGSGFLAGTDNGYQASLESFKSPERKAFNGKCLAIVQSDDIKGTITITAETDSLKGNELSIKVR
jgi:beta-galactosidase